MIVDGVAYFQDLDSGVWAVKMSTGKLLWHTKENSAQHRSGRRQRRRRQGLRRDQLDNAFALSAATGEQLWSQKLIRNKGEGIDMAPAINNGTVYVSTVPGNGVSGFYSGEGVAVLWAMNAKTGKKLWQWNEVPTSLWGNPKVNSGGGQWQPPTFDAQGHLYLEVANPAPFVGDKSYPGKKIYPNGSSHPGPNLYTDTVDELNPTTGKLIWHYQLTPHDIHDWDLNNQALISTVNGKEAIISAGKAGIAIANDAQTGKLLWKTPVGAHNGHDNDGLLTEYSARPGTARSRSRRTSRCRASSAASRPHTRPTGRPPTSRSTTRPVKSISQAANATTNYAAGTGVMVAIDQNTGKITWQHKLRRRAIRGGHRVQRPGLDDHVRRHPVGAEQGHRRGRLAHEAAGRHQRADRDRRRQRRDRRRVPAREKPEVGVHRLQARCDGSSSSGSGASTKPASGARRPRSA